jgi:hypothetical protein
MSEDFKESIGTFRANVAVVDGLLDFGDLIIKVAVDGLREVALDLEKRGLHSAAGPVRNRADLIWNIKRGDSLRPHYEAMYNQCVVLLVSHFGSAVHTLFKRAIETSLRGNVSVPAASHELKVSWQSIVESDDRPEGLFADLLISQQDISFQDMQSIARAFKNHLRVEIPKGADVHNIIAGQAARHAIVHAGSEVDDRMVRQLKDANPRDLLPSVTVGEKVRFAPQHVRLLAAAMTSYLDDLLPRLIRSTSGE